MTDNKDGDTSRRRGLAAQHWSDTDFARARNVLKQARAAGLETIRVVFADQHGVTRGKTLMIDALPAAFENGVAMTSTLLLKDTSHRTVFPVWEDDSGFGSGVLTGAADFLMLPDPTTFKILPWTPTTGWILCDIYHPDGTDILMSSRRILKDALGRLADKGMHLVSGLEVEFTVLSVQDDGLSHANADWQEAPATTRLLSHGYQHLTEGRIDRMHDITEVLRRNAQALDMPLRSIEAEFGPSQLEFVFDPLPGIGSADLMVLFRNMVKQVATRAGLHATFMSRPAFKNAMGSGWHLHQSVLDTQSGKNLFQSANGDELTQTAAQWLAGLLAHAAESCIFSTPTVNGYKRYQPFALAPDRIQWGRDNRGAMLRVIAGANNPASRIENRVGEPAANPYLYLASQVLSGLDGIDRHLVPPAEVSRPYQSQADMLPTDLGAAIAAFEASTFYRAKLGADYVDYLSHIKHAEWRRYLGVVSDWEQREYFSTF